MDEETSTAIFALCVTQHLTLKSVSKMMQVVSKNASEQDIYEMSETLGAALDAFDDVLTRTKAVIDKAAKHG
jgi:hypothetical protein